MTARLLDGRTLARAITEEIRREVLARRAAGQSQPTLAVVRVGEDPASVRYAGQIQKACANAAMAARLEIRPEGSTDSELEGSLRRLGADPAVNGILLQLPLPLGLDRARALDAIDPAKDVDGLSALSAGRLFLNRGRYFAPATPLGGLELLQRSGIAIAGKHAVIVGRSEVVGRPLALLLLRENATVTICHSQTPDLARFTRQAEILAVAVGRPNLVTAEMVSPGAVVLDFGVNVVNGAVVGDVDFASVASVASAITPVPGGTGPMTNAMLVLNTFRAATSGEGGYS